MSLLLINEFLSKLSKKSFYIRSREYLDLGPQEAIWAKELDAGAIVPTGIHPLPEQPSGIGAYGLGAIGTPYLRSSVYMDEGRVLHL